MRRRRVRPPARPQVTAAISNPNATSAAIGTASDTFHRALSADHTVSRVASETLTSATKSCPMPPTIEPVRAMSISYRETDRQPRPARHGRPPLRPLRCRIRVLRVQIDDDVHLVGHVGDHSERSSSAHDATRQNPAGAALSALDSSDSCARRTNNPSSTR